MASIYVIGSLRNPQVPEVARTLRAYGHEVYDDWYAAGPHADDWWRKYEIQRGRNFLEALQGWAARHTFENDKRHLDECDTAVLVMPGGKSSHLELGYMAGQKKNTYILFPRGLPRRFDVMVRFATGAFQSVDELVVALSQRASNVAPWSSDR